MTIYVYFEGRFVPLSEAKVGIMTHALHYGTGCFEGIRAYWNADEEQLYLFRMREHYERMVRSTKVLKIKLPLSVEELCDITVELVRRNGYREDVYIRPLAYKSTQEVGVRLHGLDDGFAIYTTPFGPYLEPEGIRCRTSSWRRVSDAAIPARAKITGLYVNSALAKSEAVEEGYDEAIMLTENGHVSEGSAENLFIVSNGRLITPPLSDDILEGITRDTIIELSREEYGIVTIERSIDRSELYTANECFLCGTGAEISPVREIDRRPIGSGRVGSLTRKLQSLYSDIVHGRHPKYRHWCSPVYQKVTA
ncbi:MAG: branched-chain amino acid transaminase [Chloroflexi bacterium]|nr:branched-chain amino acid transaminase [Chloroflexota bacterium]MCL5075941.1 branched-chain amino acid transaminase [Chloroflexota bacterium]